MGWVGFRGKKVGWEMRYVGWELSMGGMYVPFFSEGEGEESGAYVCYDAPDYELLFSCCADGGAEFGAVPCAVGEC